MLRPFPLVNRLPLPARLPYQPRKPYIPQVRQETKAVTIAAGFRCSDGVVLCSDTQITQAAGKSYESKIYRINPEADCFLVYAGDVALIKEFVAELKDITANKFGREVVKAAKSHYRRFHDKFYTQAPKTEKAFTAIILTVREGETISLYAGSGRHFYPVENYVCFGTGAPVAEPLLGPTVFNEISTIQTDKLITKTAPRTFTEVFDSMTSKRGFIHETGALMGCETTAFSTAIPMPNQQLIRVPVTYRLF
jgi:20S proteasome alpha/beta subunit